MFPVAPHRLLIAGALLGALLGGCGSAGPYDPYGANGYGTNGYGYGSDGSGYGNDTYGGSYGGDTYGGGSSYGNDTYGGGSSYGNDTYGSNYGNDTYGGGYGASPSPRPSGQPTVQVPVKPEPVGLEAAVIGVTESNPLGLGTISATVEVSNPTDIPLTGRLRVVFTDGGRPTANVYTRKVSLKPHETKALTFTATPWRLDGAEATVETDTPAPTNSTVRDR